MVYEPIVEQLFDITKICGKTAGMVLTKGRPWMKNGILGTTGIHMDGRWSLSPYIRAMIARSKNQFTVTEFVNQRPTMHSPGFNWENGTKRTEGNDALSDWESYGLKPTHNSIAEDINVIFPDVDQVEGIRSYVLRSEDDLKRYCNQDLQRKTMLQAFLSFPNLTSESYDTFFIPTFFNGKLPGRFNIASLAVKAKQVGLLGDQKISNDIILNGGCELDYIPADIERFKGQLRQSKGMWNFIEDLYGINSSYAPIDMLYLQTQFDAVKDFGQFVFEQLMSFDQKPYVGPLDFKNYITMQLIRLVAFKHLSAKIKPTDWSTNIVANIRHPGLTEIEFENSMSIYDKFWAKGSLDYVSAVGEGIVSLNLLPIGNDVVEINHFKTHVPCFNISEIPPPLAAADFAEAEKNDSHMFAKTPRIMHSDIPGRMITWDRLFGIDGLDSTEYAVIGINVITPSSVKQIIPYLAGNSDFLDRFEKGLWPIFIQIKEDTDDYIRTLMFGEREPDPVELYSIGLNSVFKGQAFGFNPLHMVKTGPIGSITKKKIEYEEDGKKKYKTVEEPQSIERLSVYPLISKDIHEQE